MSRVPKQGRDQCPMAPGRTGISAPWPQERQGSVSYGCRNDRDQCPMAKGQDRDQYSYFHLARISVWMAPGREGISAPISHSRNRIGLTMSQSRAGIHVPTAP